MSDPNLLVYPAKILVLQTLSSNINVVCPRLRATTITRDQYSDGASDGASRSNQLSFHEALIFVGSPEALDVTISELYSGLAARDGWVKEISVQLKGAAFTVHNNNN